MIGSDLDEVADSDDDYYDTPSSNYSASLELKAIKSFCNGRYLLVPVISPSNFNIYHWNLYDTSSGEYMHSI